jgi:hypothetical protein
MNLNGVITQKNNIVILSCFHSVVVVFSNICPCRYPKWYLQWGYLNQNAVSISHMPCARQMLPPTHSRNSITSTNYEDPVMEFVPML